MCLSCGCMVPDDDHNDARHITMLLVEGAAEAADVGIMDVARNILTTLDRSTVSRPSDAVLGRGVHEAYLGRLVRADTVKRYTLAVAWGLDPDKRPAADGHRVVISPDVLEETAWNFMRSRKVGLYHQNGTEGHGEIVESYIYRGPDWPQKAINGKVYVIRAGYWLVGNVWDTKAWALVQQGLLDGLSPQGVAAFRPAAAS